MPYCPPTSQSTVVPALEPPLPAPWTPQIHRLTIFWHLGACFSTIHIPHSDGHVYSLSFLVGVYITIHHSKPKVVSLPCPIPLGAVSSSFRPGGSFRGVKINIKQECEIRSLYDSVPPTSFLRQSYQHNPPSSALLECRANRKTRQECLSESPGESVSKAST